MIESGHGSHSTDISAPKMTHIPINARRDPVTTRIGAVIVILLLVIYNILFFDRYFPLTEGWFSLYAHLIKNGDVPYRDFDFFLTPLYPLQLSAFTSVFGENIFALRVFGIFVIAGIASCEYRILLRFFPPFSSAFATIASMVYFQSGVAHITYDFTQLLTLYTLLSFYFIVRGIERTESNSQEHIDARLALLFAGGFFSALAFLTKQSNGTLVVLGVISATCVARPFAEWRRIPLDLLAISLGMAAPVAAMCIWLASVGALQPCINQIFFGAIESKGHLQHIFFAWMPGFFNVTYMSQLKELARILLPIFIVQTLVLLCFRRWPIINAHGRILNALCLTVALSACSFSVIFPYYCPPDIAKYLGAGGPCLINYIIPISLSTIILLLVIGLIQRLAINSSKKIKLSPPIWASRILDFPTKSLPFAVLCLSMVAGNGTSAGLSEVGCFLGLGFFIAWMMSRSGDLLLLKFAILVLFCSHMLSLANIKYESPYAWWFISQPDIHLANYQSKNPLLNGMQLSQETVDIVDSVDAIIQSDVHKGESIFCFPHVPQFYLLNDRWPSTKAKIHWFDFLPDELAKRDAVELTAHPPGALIYVDLPELAWITHERLFRDGKPLGQRDILTAITDLTKSGLYIERYAKDLGHGCSLHVWTQDPNHKGPHQHAVLQ